MKKETVLIVHNYYQVPGGEDSVVENEKKMLVENGHEVILYTRHNDEIKKKSFIGKLLLPLETIFSFRTYFDVKKIIKNKKVDIVHVHNTLPLVSPSVYYAAKSLKIPIIQTVHNFRMLCPGATFTRKNKICEECVEKNLVCSIKNKCYRGSFIQSLVSAINLKVHRVVGTYNRVDGYIALTNFNKEKLKKIINEEKIFIKPNFVDFNGVKEIPTKDRRYFLYLGRIDKLKGIELILKAWKEIKDEELRIVGRGPCEEDVKRYIVENKISNVKLLGFKNKNEVKDILKYAKALIMASQWYEPFGMTIIESFSLSVPVITSDLGNMSNIVEDNINGLVFKYDEYNEIVNNVSRMNSNLIKKLSIQAKESYHLNYTKEKNYIILKQIYDSVGEKNETM